MEFKKIFILISFLFCSIYLFASNCSKCGFKNEDVDRYCLNCGAELREISPEEKAYLDEINKKNKTRIGDSAKQEISITKKNYRVLETDFSYKKDITFLGQTNIKVMVTATNRSKVPITNLTINIEAKCPSVWSGQTVKTLVESYEKLMPGCSTTKEISIFGAGMTLNPALKSSIDIIVKTMSWAVKED